MGGEPGSQGLTDSELLDQFDQVVGKNRVEDKDTAWEMAKVEAPHRDRLALGKKLGLDETHLARISEPGDFAAGEKRIQYENAVGLADDLLTDLLIHGAVEIYTDDPRLEYTTFDEVRSALKARLHETVPVPDDESMKNKREFQNKIPGVEWTGLDKRGEGDAKVFGNRLELKNPQG